MKRYIEADTKERQQSMALKLHKGLRLLTGQSKRCQWAMCLTTLHLRFLLIKVQYSYLEPEKPNFSSDLELPCH